MVKYKNKYYIATISIFTCLYFTSKIWLKNVYLFEGMANNSYLYVWVSALGLIYFDEILYSISITLGNLVGIFIGQILGDAIRNQNISKITENMSLQTVQNLYYHPGLEIWFVTIWVFITVSIVIRIFT